jgi:phosphatidylserine/phosphatidylglycerophosphate/cardiolipin synthase-like enzyme
LDTLVNFQRAEPRFPGQFSTSANKRVHEDLDAVQVVISKPAAPSKLASALDSTLEGAWGLHSTADVLAEMAGSAGTRFSIMTPFVDDDGASRILELFSATSPSVGRELIVRNGLPESLSAHDRLLRTLCVHVFDFRLPRADRADTETFHAKVVRVDDGECYVGSSNMTKWSFDYSLELGLLVRGRAGERVSQVIDAVLAVSNEIST